MPGTTRGRGRRTTTERAAPPACPNRLKDLWLPLGPSTVIGGQMDGTAHTTGRVRQVEVSRDGRRVYAATASGGVWYSRDEGSTWMVLGGWAVTPDVRNLDFFANTLVCGAILVDWDTTAGGENDTVYVGTGEPSPSRAELSRRFPRRDRGAAQRRPGRQDARRPVRAGVGPGGTRAGRARDVPAGVRPGQPRPGRRGDQRRAVDAQRQRRHPVLGKGQCRTVRRRAADQRRGSGCRTAISGRSRGAGRHTSPATAPPPSPRSTWTAARTGASPWRPRRTARSCTSSATARCCGG